MEGHNIQYRDTITTTKNMESYFFEVPYNNDFIQHKEKVCKDIKEQFLMKIFKQELIKHIDLNILIEMFLEDTKKLISTMADENTTPTPKTPKGKIKLRPSKSALEWAKSLGVKGDVDVPLDEDGRSWRLEKY